MQMGLRMRNGRILMGTLCVLAIPLAGQSASGELPADVESGHWAAHAVQEVISNQVLPLGSGQKFHGEDIVTHTQAIIALSKLARKLEKGTWRVEPSMPLSTKTVIPTLVKGDWKQRPITRYALASILARFGDYFANSIPHPDGNAKDMGKSEALWNKVKVTVAKTNPAYDALVYLAANRMIEPKSPLLTPDSLPIKAAEMTQALSVMATGLNDRLTDIGHDAEGATHDEGFHKKRNTAKP